MITTHVESFIGAIPELAPLFPMHWEELALFKDRMPLDIDFCFYRAAEDRGELLFITSREAGRLVGYFVGIVGHSPHYQGTLTCKMDVVYLVPEHRGAGVGGQLVNAVEAELKRRGVKCWWMGSKNHKPIEALFVTHGFEPAETYFAKWLED